MSDYGDCEEEVLQAGGLVDWSREQEIRLAGGDRARGQWNQGGVNEVEEGKSSWRVGRVFLKTGDWVDC